jgi:hypothetical protein
VRLRIQSAKKNALEIAKAAYLANCTQVLFTSHIVLKERFLQRKWPFTRDGRTTFRNPSEIVSGLLYDMFPETHRKNKV